MHSTKFQINEKILGAPPLDRIDLKKGYIGYIKENTIIVIMLANRIKKVYNFYK